MNTLDDEDDAERQEFIPRVVEEKILSECATGSQGESSSIKRHLRLVLEICMAFTIVILLIQSTHAKNIKKSPVPVFPLKTYTFTEDLKYVNESMFSTRDATLRTLHNWVELSATGRGYVKIDNPDTFGLSDPYTIDVHSTPQPVYMMSVFHQLHCLSYVVQAYQSAFGGAELTQELAHHSAHCFDYLRQSIMCAADTTLEGETDSGPGWGSKHECPDYDALLDWANEHTVMPWRANTVDTSIL